jgi:hypothetical protein
MFKRASGLNSAMTVSLDQLLGSWRLLSAWHEFETSQRRYPYGSDPVGSLVFTDDHRMMMMITTRVRPPAASNDELFRTMEAYSGRFMLEGSELITTVDVSWMPDWKRKPHRCFLSLSADGNSLFVTIPKQTGPLRPEEPVTNALTWLRERTLQNLRKS